MMSIVPVRYFVYSVATMVVYDILDSDFSDGLLVYCIGPDNLDMGHFAPEWDAVGVGITDLGLAVIRLFDRDQRFCVIESPAMPASFH